MKTIFMVLRSESETAEHLVHLMEILFPECEVHVIHDPTSKPSEDPEKNPALS